MQMTENIVKAIKEVWNDVATQAFFNGICNQVNKEDRQNANAAMRDFVNSMWVSILKIRNRGGILAPTFRVYANGYAINDDRIWCKIRSYLASRDYVIPFEDPGVIIIPTTECSLCHGADHPRGLCPFPSIVDWHGPRTQEDPPLTDPSTGRNIYGLMPKRDRNRNRGGRF